MDSKFVNDYSETQKSGALQKKYLERSYKIARSMFDPLPPKNSSLFHPKEHNDKIEVEITTIRKVNGQQFPQNRSRTPKNASNFSRNNLSYTLSPNSPSRTPNRTPSRIRVQSNENRSSSTLSNKNYYQFLDDYSSSFMNSNNSSPNYSPKYGNGRNSYYYHRPEPIVSKHFSPNKQSPNSKTPDAYERSHISPPSFRYRSLDDNDGNLPRNIYNNNKNTQNRNLSQSDIRKSVGIQRGDAGKYQYEEEPFNKFEEEEEDNEENVDIDSELKMTASTISDLLNDDQLAKDRELLKKNFHHDNWNGQAENVHIDDSKLDQRVKMIISKLKEQNSTLSAQNSQIDGKNENFNDDDDVIFLNDAGKNDTNVISSNKPNFNEENANVAKKNMQKIYSTDYSMPQNLADTQVNVAYEFADKITHNANQKIINLDNKNNS